MDSNKINLYHGDCLDVMGQIPDNSIDMVLTDPPYSSGGLHAGDRKKSTREKYTDCGCSGAAALPSFSGDNMDQRSFVEFMRMVFSRARVKTKPGGVAAAFVDWRNLPALTDAIQAAGWIWRGIVVWDKGKPALPGCYHIPSIPACKRHHQTEKPIELLEALLQISPDDAMVLDPFMGSGNTGVACIKTGRRFIGAEISGHYYTISTQRINEAENAYKLAYTE